MYVIFLLDTKTFTLLSFPTVKIMNNTQQFMTVQINWVRFDDQHKESNKFKFKISSLT